MTCLSHSHRRVPLKGAGAILLKRSFFLYKVNVEAFQEKVLKRDIRLLGNSSPSAANGVSKQGLSFQSIKYWQVSQYHPTWYLTFFWSWFEASRGTSWI